MSLVRTTVYAAMTGIVAICLIVFLGRSDVRAEEGPSSEPAGEPQEPPVDEAGVEATPVEPRNYFQLYPADEGALTYNDLSEDEKAAADRAAEWAETDSGYEVHQAWARGTAWARAHAKVVISERNSGLEGAEETGVE